MTDAALVSLSLAHSSFDVQARHHRVALHQTRRAHQNCHRLPCLKTVFVSLTVARFRPDYLMMIVERMAEVVYLAQVTSEKTTSSAHGSRYEGLDSL